MHQDEARRVVAKEALRIARLLRRDKRPVVEVLSLGADDDIWKAVSILTEVEVQLLYLEAQQQEELEHLEKSV